MKFPKMLYVAVEGNGREEFLASYETVEDLLQGTMPGDATKVAVYRLEKVESRTLVVK